MSVLYDILNPNDLINIDEEEKILFLSEIITFGKMKYFEKFNGILDKNIFSVISATDILRILPMVIDPELFRLILHNYHFEQGQHFFYNYAINNTNSEIKDMVYDYFVDNFSHLLIEKRSQYDCLLETHKK